VRFQRRFRVKAVIRIPLFSVRRDWLSPNKKKKLGINYHWAIALELFLVFSVPKGQYSGA
jgi:hypothetical protein